MKNILLIIVFAFTLSACNHMPVAVKEKVTFFSKDEIVSINEELLKPCRDMVELDTTMDTESAILDFVVKNSVVYSECSKRQRGAAKLLEKALNYHLKGN